MAILWLSGTNDVHDMRSSCAPAAGGPGCPSSRIDSDKTKIAIGDVFMGLAVAGVATGALLIVLHRGGPESPHLSSTVTWSLVPTPWGGQISAAAAF
jgi:hypothetical protein